ncbi:RHS repeat protein [Affinibrenneria salicis]|uniref:RHS repeat protein n=1 Tax=Affinibrenneria salicis TaxID=2590031 RepID=A0A5J5FVP8_9GAMM|nr:RHS repeat protein [Affinibrenneria salicis]KAA8997700.1 RHS repeat protein [Affinibrenneria salicis]
MYTVNRYDERGRLSESENAEGDITRYRYNEAGDLIAIVYPDGNDEQFQYSPRGEPVAHLQGGLTRCFGYDPAGRLIRLVNENGAETQFSYDLMNRLTLETGFDGRIRRYRYNPVGLLIQSEDAGRVTDWHDDEADQLVRQVWQNYDAQNTCSLNPESSASGAQYSTAWRYDVMGRLSGAEHLNQGNNVSIHYQYNAVGQVIAEQQTVSTPDGVRLWRHEVNHEYDVLGGRTVSIPDGLPPLRWQTYGSGHLLGLALGGQNLVAFERDDLHRETECRFGQHVLNRHHSAAGRLQSLQIDDSPQHPLSYRYGYDKRGQLIH